MAFDDDFVKAVGRSLARGDATEHSHRPALKAFVEGVSKSVSATNEPKRIKVGAPDFRVYVGRVPVGHIETKDIGTNLDEIERGKGRHGEQFLRFKKALPNWILTDYLEFRWFVDGEKRLTARLATLDGKRKITRIDGGEKQVLDLLLSFIQREAPVVSSAPELAGRLAGMAVNIRQLIVEAMKEEKAGWLTNWLAAFRQTLVPDLDESRFADMFAQTIAYGLFTARMHAPKGEEFSRERSSYHLPRTNPFLRKLFGAIAGPEMPPAIDWAVDDIVELLKRADIDAIRRDFGKVLGREDPVVHFYERFLEVYDPEIREKRGVYYTPEPVVHYIVESIDLLLQSEFGKKKGLADENTLVLDPAVGTATFLYRVIGKVYERFAKQMGAWPTYVSTHLLERIFGFELLMAPYAIAHLKLGMELQETGYAFATDQRLGVYLTNTLEEAIKKSKLLFAEWVSDEANAAAAIKKERPVLVVLGNPPYSGVSANRTRDDRGELTFIGKLMEDYKQVDGHPLGERKTWLQDDYVKFIRFAEWRIDRTGEGIIGYITNHGYLENPTFRGMRRHLMQTFSDIYVYDLHGSQKKRENVPGGLTDKNVFDITVGVALLLCVKRREGGSETLVRHADLWGTREAKYDVLSTTDVTTTAWTELTPAAPDYLFVPVDAALDAEYGSAPSIDELFRLKAVGAVTARDDLTIAFTEDEMWEQVKDFAALTVAEARREYNLGKDARDWKVSTAQEDVRRSGPRRENIQRILVRPFDVRYTYYTGRARGFYASPCENVLRHLFVEGNIGLVTSKRVETGQGFEHVFCTRLMIQHHSVSVKEVNYLLPLILYPREGENGQGALGFDAGPQPNVNEVLVKKWSGALGLRWTGIERGDLKETFGARDLFEYTYAILQSPSYRRRYGDQLRRDFPRIPLSGSKEQVAALARKGRSLVELHLLESGLLDASITEFPTAGTNLVEKVRHDSTEGRVWINEEQSFVGVPSEVWEFTIGGYQVCKRWMEDRRGRTLSFDEIEHYHRVVKAVFETQRIAREVDASIPKWPLQAVAKGSAAASGGH